MQDAGPQARQKSEPRREPGRGRRPPGRGGLALAHVSDLHVTAPRIRHPAELLGKRALGYLAWRRRRRHEHQPAVLDALLRDLAAARVDHVAVTGDLTQIGLADEIREAGAWLRRIGPPGRVSLVPGNHDAYAGPQGPERFGPWAPYLGGAELGGAELGGAEPGADPEGGAPILFPARGAASAAAGASPAGGAGAPVFPFVRRVGPVGLVGISSARPTAPLLATGRIGGEQLARVEAALGELRREGRFRVVLLHHPPLPCGQSRRRRLGDAALLRALLARTGAELVLHGHTHRSSFERLPGPSGPIPVVAVPSATSIGPRPERLARYHVYRIAWDAEATLNRVTCAVRAYDGRGTFNDAGLHPL